jgi:hypothetical protein
LVGERSGVRYDELVSSSLSEKLVLRVGVLPARHQGSRRREESYRLLAFQAKKENGNPGSNANGRSVAKYFDEEQYELVPVGDDKKARFNLYLKQLPQYAELGHLPEETSKDPNSKYWNQWVGDIEASYRKTKTLPSRASTWKVTLARDRTFELDIERLTQFDHPDTQSNTSLSFLDKANMEVEKFIRYVGHMSGKRELLKLFEEGSRDDANGNAVYARSFHNPISEERVTPLSEVVSFLNLHCRRELLTNDEGRVFMSPEKVLQIEEQRKIAAIVAARTVEQLSKEASDDALPAKLRPVAADWEEFKEIRGKRQDLMFRIVDLLDDCGVEKGGEKRTVPTPESGYTPKSGGYTTLQTWDFMKSAMKENSAWKDLRKKDGKAAEKERQEKRKEVQKLEEEKEKLKEKEGPLSLKVERLEKNIKQKHKQQVEIRGLRVKYIENAAREIQEQIENIKEKHGISY